MTNLYEGSIVHNDNSEARVNRISVMPYLREDKEQKTFSNSYLKFGNSDMVKTQPSLYQTLYSASSPKFAYSTGKSHTL